MGSPLLLPRKVVHVDFHKTSCQAGVPAHRQRLRRGRALIRSSLRVVAAVPNRHRYRSCRFRQTKPACWLPGCFALPAVVPVHAQIGMPGR